MRRFSYPEHSIAKISLFLLLTIVALSCNSLKKIENDEYLVARNTILVDSLRITDEDVNSLIYQKPNTALLGYPLRLNLYNLAKENPDSLYQDWLNRKPNRKKRLTKFLSEKQVNRLGESFLVKGLSEWLKEIGEAPTVLDTSKTRRSLERLSAYYDSKGYFLNTTTYDVDTTRRKQRAYIDYKIDLGKPYVVDSVSNEISSKAIDSIYFLNMGGSFVKEGKQFNLADFNGERERLTEIFRNNGIRNFQGSSITFDIVRDTVRAEDDQKMNITLNIGDLKRRGENEVTTSEYKVEKINTIDVYTDYLASYKSTPYRSITYGDFTFHYSDNFQIKPKTLADAILFEKGAIYRDIDKIRTSRQLNNLNIFKYPNVIFEEDSTGSKVNTSIYLAPKPKYSLGTNFEISRSNLRRLGVGAGASLLIRNIFKGAENLSLSVDGAFGLLSREIFQEDYFSEIGGEVTLDFPRIWFPFINTSKLIPNYTLPKTRIALGTSFQKNIGLDKQTFNTTLGYNWTPNEFKRNSIELLNVQYVRNVNSNRFFDVYRTTYNQLNDIATDQAVSPLLDPTYFNEDGNLTTPSEAQPETTPGTTGFISDVRNGLIPTSNGGFTEEDFNNVNSIAEREERLTENNLIFATNYTFNKNNRNGITDNNFYQFRFKLESAGNLLSGISNLIAFNENDREQLLVFGVPFSQYVKTEFDFVKYWDLSRSNVLAARTFVGIAIPYGNSENIPFVRSYFAGGSNDNRAWFPYSLGPGSTSAINDFNEANLKIALNLEYRFPIVGDINGALFADAGNIWNVFDDVENPDAIFSGFDSLKDIALGSGFGLRYDFTYFLFRLDLGFKTYNPAEIPSKRWFRDYNFANSVLQIGINYPF